MPEQTTQSTSNGTILFVANDSQNRYGLLDLLEQSGYFVYNRDSFVRGFQLMTVYQLDLIICDQHLPDTSGLEFCRRLREDPTYNNIPFLLIGEDDPYGSNCIEALDTGADEYLTVPLIEGVLLARIRRLLRKQAPRSAVQSTLSGQTTSNELAGIMQYLETELKVGKLEIKSDQGTGLIYIREGRIVNAVAPSGDGLEAIEEILCWPTSHVAFHEGPVTEANLKMDAEITGVLMNCSVAVDEFKEAQSLLPGPTAMFAKIEALPAESNPEKHDLMNRIGMGDSLEDLLNNSEFGERKATLALYELIQEKILKVFESPYENYLATCYGHYKHSSFIESRLIEVRRVLTALTFPLPTNNGFVPTGTSDWLSPAPRLLVCGDNSDHVGLFANSLRAFYASATGRKPPERKQLRRSITLRLDFEDKAILDVQILPSKLDETLLSSLNEYMSDVCGVLCIVSAQDRASNAENLRVIRQLRQRFHGVYYHVASRVATRDSKYMFKINCVHCGYKLAVNMDESGFTGECPICSNPLTIPDPLDNLSVALQLPEEVPVVMLEPADPNQVRDLIVMEIDSVLHACNPPDAATIAAHEANMLKSKDKKRTLQIKVADTRTITMPTEASMPASDPSRTEYLDVSGVGAADFDAERTVTRPIIIRKPAPQAPGSPSSRDASSPSSRDARTQELMPPTAPMKASPPPAPQAVPQPSAPQPPASPDDSDDDIQSLLSRIGGNSMDLDDILNSDDEDIDDFISKIKR